MRALVYPSDPPSLMQEVSILPVFARFHKYPERVFRIQLALEVASSELVSSIYSELLSILFWRIISLVGS